MRNDYLNLSSLKGFTLVEIAIAMTLAGLLAGGGLLLIKTRVEQALRAETAAYMDEVKKSLRAYVKVNGVLPTPDQNGDGEPDTMNSNGDGWLPYKRLGVKPADAWGRQLKYHIAKDLDGGNGFLALTRALQQSTWPPPNQRSLVSSLSPTVCEVDPGGSVGGMAVLIVSYGPNGKLDKISNLCDNALAKTIMQEYSYIRHAPTKTFDDLVVYVGANSMYDWITYRPF